MRMAFGFKVPASFFDALLQKKKQVPPESARHIRFSRSEPEGVWEYVEGEATKKKRM